MQPTKEIGGGYVVASCGKILGEVALPAYGLMSDQDASTTTEQIHHLETMLHTLGVRKTIDLVNLTFVALPVIPRFGCSTQDYMMSMKENLSISPLCCL